MVEKIVELDLKPPEQVIVDGISGELINKIVSTIEFFEETKCEVLGIVGVINEEWNDEEKISRFASVKLKCNDAVLYAPIARFVYSTKEKRLIYIEIFTAGEALNLAYTWHIP
jgi:hypothetical protein